MFLTILVCLGSKGRMSGMVVGVSFAISSILLFLRSSVAALMLLIGNWIFSRRLLIFEINSERNFNLSSNLILLSSFAIMCWG